MKFRVRLNSYHSADYYTGHQSHYDRWHGKLAKRLKLSGELSKGEFETFCQNIAEEERRKRIGFDATFSAPKSVSLALAESDERREELIRIHQTAVERVLAEIEKNHLRTRSNGKKLSARNMTCRSCPNSLWMCQQDDLVCFCRATRYVIWQASKPKKNITLLCSGRIGRSADGELDETAKTAIEYLSREAFAFSIPEVCHRIMDEGVLERISQKEAQAAIAYNAQVLFSGDYDQLPPAGAGEPFKALIEAGAGTAYLEDIRRQRDLELLEAVRQSVKGDTLKTYEILEKRGDYTVRQPVRQPDGNHWYP